MPRPAPWSTNRRVIKELDRAFWTAFNGEGTDAEKMERFVILAAAIRMEGKPSRKQLKERWRNSKKRLVSVVNARSTSLTTISHSIATTQEPRETEASVLHGQRAEGKRTAVESGDRDIDVLLESLSEVEPRKEASPRNGNARLPAKHELADHDDVEDVI